MSRRRKRSSILQLNISKFFYLNNLINYNFNSRHQAIIKSGEEGRNRLLDSVKLSVNAEKDALAGKEREITEAQDKFDEIASGLNAMLKSIQVDYAIGNMGDMLESLGVIEDKINELIAAKAVLLEELDPENITEIKRMLVPDPPAIAMNDEENILGVAPSTRSELNHYVILKV